jgi:hypothetical protein
MLDRRIKDLGSTNKAIANRADIDTSSLYKLRKGQDVSDDLRRRVDVAVRWPEGTLERIAHDPTFSPPSDALTDPERMARLEARFEELAETVQRLAQEIERRQ